MYHVCFLGVLLIYIFFVKTKRYFEWIHLGGSSRGRVLFFGMIGRSIGIGGGGAEEQTFPAGTILPPSPHRALLEGIDIFGGGARISFSPPPSVYLQINMELLVDLIVLIVHR